MMTDFTGRVAVITGGASGIGESTAHTFAQAGAIVAVLDRDSERAALVRSEIVAAGGDAHSFILDLREEDGVRATIDAIISRFGRIDVLDNNAAALELTADDADILNCSAVTFTESIRGDLLPAFLMTKYVLPVMVEQGAGSIINISSVTGMAGEPWLTAYGVAKAGLIQLTRATATQYSRLGVNAIAPSYVTTRNNENLVPKELKSIYEHNVLTARVVNPQDIANMALFLGSDESTMITGHVIPVDGGITASSPIVSGFRDWQAGDHSASPAS
jgi:NAD(P)-dependent dehydrogenase (short-subunit alcohol dehydrogenase family)